MEKLFGGPVCLEIWVKVKSGWADNEAGLRAYGYGNRSLITAIIPHSGRMAKLPTERNEIVLEELGDFAPIAAIPARPTRKKE